MLDIFAALADPTRVRILLLIRDLQLSMGELAEILDQSQPRVSRHVRILAEAGLVRRYREGAWVFVGTGEHVPTAEIHALIAKLLPERDPIATERQRLAAVRAERQKAVDHWFEAHAGEWDRLRRLQGEDAAIEAAIVAAAREPRVGRLLDIGTGTGRMLELLAGDADQALGIDRSAEMLRVARGKLAGQGIEGAEVRQADMRALPFEPASFDTVTLHHVLHFADQPDAVIGEAARVLAPGGKLLVADYGPHRVEELRSEYRHVRLGFDDESMSGWLAEAGLAPRLVSRHPGPALSVTLWEGRR
jgi:ArsR family transcriptional regulator